MNEGEVKVFEARSNTCNFGGIGVCCFGDDICDDHVHDDCFEVGLEGRRVSSSEEFIESKVKSIGSIPKIMKVNKVWVVLEGDVNKVESGKIELVSAGTSHCVGEDFSCCIEKRISL